MNVDQALGLIREEWSIASARYAKFHSAHEGYAVILEEMDELWREVMKKSSPRTNDAELQHQAIQVAAMALRFLLDVSG